MQKEKETTDKVKVDLDLIGERLTRLTKRSVLFGDLLHNSRKQKFEENLIQVLIKYVSSKS